MWFQFLPWSGQAPVVITKDLINTVINLMKCGWVFVPLCCDKRCCTLNCKYCQNLLALPLKKNSKGGTSLCSFVLCVHRRGCEVFFSFKDFQWFSVISCFSSGWGHCLCSWRSLCWGSVLWEGLDLLQKLLGPHGIHGIHPIWFFSSAWD